MLPINVTTALTAHLVNRVPDVLAFLGGLADLLARSEADHIRQTGRVVEEIMLDYAALAGIVARQITAERVPQPSVN